MWVKQDGGLRDCVDGKKKKKRKRKKRRRKKELSKKKSGLKIESREKKKKKKKKYYKKHLAIAWMRKIGACYSEQTSLCKEYEKISIGCRDQKGKSPKLTGIPCGAG
jgi:hypothetical protein